MKKKMQKHKNISQMIYSTAIAAAIFCIPTAHAAKPIVNSPQIANKNLSAGQTTEISVIAADLEAKPLVYQWKTTIGTIEGDGATVQYTAPENLVSNTFNTVTVNVSNGVETTTKNSSFSIQKLINTANIAITGPNTQLELGETGFLNVIVEPNGNQIKGIELDITYDPFIIEVIDANPQAAGVQVQSNKNASTQKNQVVRFDGDPLHHVQTTLTFANPITQTTNILQIPFKTKSTNKGADISIAESKLTSNDTSLAIPTQHTHFQFQTNIQENNLEQLKSAASEIFQAQAPIDITQPQLEIETTNHGTHIVQQKQNTQDLAESGPAIPVMIAISCIGSALMMRRRSRSA